ncbi:MAG TPA: TGS domain-containing protein, partial [Alphaproteobacteria bacterium]
MVAITLPDGKSLSFDGPVTPADVAAKIGPGLAKAALAAKVDGKLWDLTRPV